MNKTDIVVIGGYGHVGSGICMRLGELFPGKVIAAGRSLGKAQAYSERTEGRIRPLALNVQEIPSRDWFDSVKLAVMCLDQQNTAWAEACLRSGTHYVDISAKAPFLQELKKLDRKAREAGATAVCSVGLAPGLTNLLALETAVELDEATDIAISIMLGLGEKHGRAAIEWTIDSYAGAPFKLIENGQPVWKRPFTDGRKADFGSSGRRTAYRFPFSDQLTLAETIGAASVATRLCFDSRFVTASLGAAAALRLPKLLAKEGVKAKLADSFDRFSLGSDRYAVRVDTLGMKNGERVCSSALLTGRGEGEATAAAAAATSQLIYTGQPPAGVYHSEELFHLLEQKGVLQLATQDAWSNRTNRLRAKIDGAVLQRYWETWRQSDTWRTAHSQ
ncbi:saccharopine dehydrogenase [Paenibacillus pinisoli]|uniref:Saccharopine dehydrogenase n=1 Tax=Paenibacillus pinisoli TaxID=1276110 RepID=A0A3A6PDT2_9BACL|nr:saccharopine dehydrogenase NADP-binding domain-containing protein [Paenibacillus pinisoli]RJX39732.1 saccharopine dehydrogenase [Paenibacillus pinisoli]